MPLKHFAYIYMSPGFSPEKDTITTKSEQCRFTAVGIELGQQADALQVVKDLVADGAQMIEVCGGFGPKWLTKFSEAIEYAVPIGGAFYGPEAREQLLTILKE